MQDCSPDQPLAQIACTVLTTPLPADKVRLTRQAATDWRAGRIADIGAATPPARPARPDTPILLSPHKMPKRGKAGSVKSRIALLHALAHIELNAIDLAWDMIARFAVTVENGTALPRAYADDWVMVADDEAKHHALLAQRLASLGASYGDLPAHDGLWQAAEATAHDFAARLAVVPMVLEARGLDVTPAMIEGLMRVGDADSAGVLQIIHDDEIGHVAAGKRWFDWVAARRGYDDPDAAWRSLVQTHFTGSLKRPFNEPSRTKADFPADWYEPLGVG